MLIRVGNGSIEPIYFIILFAIKLVSYQKYI